MNITRRQFALAAGAVSLAAASRKSQGEDTTSLRWPPYADAIAVDGLGGLGRYAGTPGELNELELEDARASGLTGIRLSIAPEGQFWFSDAAYQLTLSRISEWDRRLIAHPETLTQILTGKDFARAKRERRAGLIYGFQETSPIGEDLDRIDVFYRAGVRVIQLTHNRRNLVGDGAMEPGNAGLSNFGHEMIEALNAKRIVVDLAHGARRTISEAIPASHAPVIISHTGCAALSDLPRCVTDESLRAMADRGGVAGIIFWPYLRKDGQPMAIDVIRHIEHAIKVCGEDHVGIGTDASLSAVPRTPEADADNRKAVESLFEQGILEKGRSHDLLPFIPDLNDVRRFDMLAAMLSQRGHSDTRIIKVLGGNFARVMSEVWS